MDKYFEYAYYDEQGKYIGVYEKDTPKEILEKAKIKYDIVKRLRGINEY